MLVIVGKTYQLNYCDNIFALYYDMVRYQMSDASGQVPLLYPLTLSSLPGFFLGPNKAYFRAFPALLTWHAANESCVSDGGRLPVLDSPELNEFVREKWRQLENPKNKLWIGGYANEKRLWQWVNGNYFGYKNWEYHENPAHGCLALNCTTGFWTYRPCDGGNTAHGKRKYSFLCEYAAIKKCFISRWERGMVEREKYSGRPTD